jgi:hypothetical protein
LKKQQHNQHFYSQISLSQIFLRAAMGIMPRSQEVKRRGDSGWNVGMRGDAPKLKQATGASKKARRLSGRRA